MKRTHWRLLQILLFLFALNFVTLLLYFTTQHHHKNNSNSETEKNNVILLENRLPLTGNRPLLTEYRRSHSLKPWPLLPSYLPWSLNQNVVPRSCEGYFGNGFTRRIDLLPSLIHGASSFGGGWFRCFYSETLRSSICEGGKVRMVPERIKMSRGGERLEEVVGRGEEEELPEFLDGAFEVLGDGRESRKRRRLASEEFLDQYVTEGEISPHTMRELVRSVRVVEDNEFQCDEVRALRFSC